MRIPESLKDRAHACHGRIPGIRKLPLQSVFLIFVLVVANCMAWAAAGIVLHGNPALVSTAVLAYTLGLRHALDADHISAIDLTTRRLVADGQKPATVGTFFSLGHSTIVIITSIAVAATATAISSRFDSFSRVGGIIGTSFSAGVLCILGLMNVWILCKLIAQMQTLLRSDVGAEEGRGFTLRSAGCMSWVLRGLFRLIDRPWKMYPLGVVFGLGFDTSSEVALLGIASVQGSKETSIWAILIFPVLFTVGMCLLDTIDGALMLSLYTSTSLAKDPIAILYYSIVLTITTIIVAVVIGVIQLLSLVLNVAEPSGPFWDGVRGAGDHYDIIGGSICASFLVFGGLSMLLYKPWRRRVDFKRAYRQEENEMAALENRPAGGLAEKTPVAAICKAG